MRRKTIRAAKVRLIAGLGMHACERTPAEEIRALLRDLRPVHGGVELLRIGPDGDGGYLVPDDLEGIRYVFSPGVSTESGFEAALADRGMPVFLADHSVDGPAVPHARFVFDKKFVGCLTNEQHMTLDDWHTARVHDADAELLLQMDIEGGEYETLLATAPRLLNRFRIMVVEFHWLAELWNRPFFTLAARTFRKLLQTHSVLHIHPNNCCGSVTSEGIEIPRIAEFTLLRTDRLRAGGYRSAFPHPLDRPNVAKAPLHLPACWYS
jgi:hypothetical protein